MRALVCEELGSVSVAVPIPETMDAARAATFAQSHCTALFALRERGGLAAGGGVGLAAVQVATALGGSRRWR